MKEKTNRKEEPEVPAQLNNSVHKIFEADL